MPSAAEECRKLSGNFALSGEWSAWKEDKIIICANEVDCQPVSFLIIAPYKYFYLVTIQYDSVYLTCSKNLKGSQLSPPHGTNNKLQCETKNIIMSMIGPLQSRCHEGSPVGKRSLRWEGFVEKVGFEPGVKE